jgi:two-component system, NtrC family, sensor kinase
MTAPRSFRRDLLLSLSMLFGGALLLALAVLFVALPFLDGPRDALLLAGALIAADLVILHFFARSLLRRSLIGPLDRMILDARKIEGDPYGAEQMDPVGTEELDKLAESVNAMAERLIRNQQMLARNIASLDETNAELVAARDEVVRSARLASVGSLAAGMAHEIGNPLGAVITYLDLSRGRAAAGEDPTELLEAATRESRRIDRIIRSLLDYARPQPEVEGGVDPAVIATRVRTLLEAQGRFEGIDVTWEVPSGLPLVRVDPQHLEQVLVNLVLNALDALTEVTERRLRVSVRQTPWKPPPIPFRREGDPPGTNYAHRRRIATDPVGARRRLLEATEVVEVTVTDSGPGLPPELAPRVFDPFFTTKAPGKGTGLGLAICSRLVEEMGGRIDLETEAGAGATFRVLLPVTAETDDATDDEAPGEEEMEENA